MTTETEIGPEGCMIQLTSRPDPAWVDAPPTTLLTVRAGKDTDLTEPQLRELAAALLVHADFIAQGAP